MGTATTSARRWFGAALSAALTAAVLTVGGAPATAAVTPCTGTNNTDTAIPDLGSVDDPIALSGCASTASAASTVEVHIVHTYRGDLVVTLVAPDGSAYVLANRQGGSADNIDQTFTVNLSAENPNGTWKLRVQDAAASDTGYVNTWRIDAAFAPPGCAGTNATDFAIPDPGTVESAVTLAGCPAGTASNVSTVEVHVVHTYRGDLVVTLVAPDGSTYVLANRQGGSADNIDQTFTLNLSSETRNGTWKLRVQDAAASDTGYVNTWTITT
ncbi:proprotein convertase P-domain-containing protein [Dactylosporangium vinaceum]|uniref:Proprotein convertase P-domain-containing protein n=1 Tax=Dactylosporangium vinaceum TaxID=53362 RepID=A0ABV5MDP9_9ACTN|nr:proprotein convertase P-domain-containing protein [Dactylosporangium vinaceum]